MPRCRPFKLFDAMILVATAALGMAEMRPGWNQFQMFWAGTKRAPTWQAYGGMAQTGLTIALLNLAMAYVWIRLIPPRLPGSDLIRQPGMLLLVLLIGLAFLYMALSAFVPPVAETNMIIALALGLSWGAACRRYRSRAEPGWIEGLGRSFGVGLVVAIAASYP
jgi:multisubunit Na+/H+ antiporter MnhB subunit